MKIQLNRLDVISFVHIARALSSALWSKSKTNYQVMLSEEERIV